MQHEALRRNAQLDPSREKPVIHENKLDPSHAQFLQAHVILWGNGGVFAPLDNRAVGLQNRIGRISKKIMIFFVGHERKPDTVTNPGTGISLAKHSAISFGKIRIPAAMAPAYV